MENTQLPQTQKAPPNALAVAQREVMRNMETVEPSHNLSQQDTAIIQASAAHPRLMSIPITDQEGPFRMLMIKLGVLYGIPEQKLPADELLGVMILYLNKHFRTATLEEILLAAELNLAGEIQDPTTGKQIQTFGEIDIRFITTLLRAHSIRKVKAYQELSRIRADQAPKERQVATPKECYEGLLQYLEEKSMLPEFWNWNAVFEFMWKEKLFTETVDEMKAWKEKEAAAIRQEILSELSEVPTIMESARASLSQQLEVQSIESECRKRYIKKCLSKLESGIQSTVNYETK
jgi:hypothetical protein